MEFVGYEQLSVGTIAVPFGAVPPTATGVLLTIKNDVRLRADGPVPTQGANGVGYLLRDTDGPLHLLGIGQTGLTALQFVRGGGSNATVYATYVKEP